MGEGDPTPNSRASPATRPEDVATTAETTSQGSRTAEPPLEPAGVERLRSQFGSTGTLQRLVELFASQTPKDIAGLRTAIAAADALSVRDSAHTLKGRCLTLAATQMAELCSKLETLASGDSLDGADALVEQIERAFSATHDALLVEVS
jgi:HPt (histidine-containing phosphotransfer) domain-containing protein